ncbi:MAG: XRE family transcriptional regulator [Clostridiales bacterium]|nr:MAG: XRE family transcriptional regulator [Clostridiales bacterium]
MHKAAFGKRLYELRQKTKMSARDLSFSLGQSASYINKIENGKSYPSMQRFFEICDYLNITPHEFFDENRSDPEAFREIIQNLGRMNGEQVEAVRSIADQLAHTPKNRTRR